MWVDIHRNKEGETGWIAGGVEIGSTRGTVAFTEGLLQAGPRGRETLFGTVKSAERFLGRGRNLDVICVFVVPEAEEIARMASQSLSGK